MAKASDPTSITYRGMPNGKAYRASKQGGPQHDCVTGFVRSNLRGQSEEAGSGWGKAGDPQVSGETILSVIQGERDADASQFVHGDGVYP